MAIELSTVVKQSADQVSCNLNDEVVVLNLTSSLYYGLDEVGARVWEAVREPKQVGDVCQAVMDQFDVTQERCRTDVLDFLERLEKAGLIQFEG